MGIAETKIDPINTGWLEADLGTYIFWKGPAGKDLCTIQDFLTVVNFVFFRRSE